MPRKKQPKGGTPSASDMLDAWQKTVHEQWLNPENMADWLRAATGESKAQHDEPKPNAPAAHDGDDAIAALKRHLGRLERRIAKLERTLDGHVQRADAKAAKPRRTVAKPATKPRAKPKRAAKKPTKK